MTSEGKTKSKGDGDDALMDYAPGKVLGTEELGSIRVSRLPPLTFGHTFLVTSRVHVGTETFTLSTVKTLFSLITIITYCIPRIPHVNFVSHTP